MRWDESVAAVLPHTGDRVVLRIRSEWAGARIYLPFTTARLRWRDANLGPTGAAERFAAALQEAVLDAGGTESSTRAILLPLAGTHFVL